MTQPIYKGYMGRLSEAWYQLSQAEQTQLLGRMDEKLTELGGKRLITCDARWSSDQWHFFGVEEFPSLEALQQYHAFLAEIHWLRYIEGVTALGTQMA
jgi:hypothetical protein